MDFFLLKGFYGLVSLLQPFHGKRYALASQVYSDDANPYMLMEVNHLRGVADVAVGQLRYVYQSVLMDADVYEGSEIGDIRHDTR